MPTMYKVPPEDVGDRLDHWLSRQCPDLSRSHIQRLIQSGHVLLNGARHKNRHLVAAGDRVSLDIPPPPDSEPQPEAISLDILFEDEQVLVINKPPGLVVHPAVGHPGGTLVNALLHHGAGQGRQDTLLRQGIVHRLDKDTSGALVVAKTEQALASLQRQFKERTVQKRYRALVRGRVLPESGAIETLIGRHPRNRKKMSVQVENGRSALTHYTTVQQFAEATLLDVMIETGRTHQIRVHMVHVGHPVLGDRQYGRTHSLSDGTPIDRQMLHAAQLTFCHPVTGTTQSFSAPLPGDMETLIQRLHEIQPATAATQPSRGFTSAWQTGKVDS